MASLNISILGEDAPARASAAQMLGKKGSADDLAFYHTVYQGKLVSSIDPVSYPAKLSCMLQAISLAEHALVIAEAPTPAFAELIVALDLLGPKPVFAGPIEFPKFLANTSLASSPTFESAAAAKDHLLAQESERKDGPALVFIDHCFEVKGIGTVALGVVKRGAVRVHDKLRALPLGKEVEVRSIQMNDKDEKESFAGDRVGLSLRNTKSDEISRGAILVAADAPDAHAAKSFDCTLTPVKFLKAPFESGPYHLLAGLQFEPCKVEFDGKVQPGASAKARIHLEKPFAFEKGERLLVCNLNAKGVRILASAIAGGPA
jgi:selenocysteine-specific translation elongation factor